MFFSMHLVMMGQQTPGRAPVHPPWGWMLARSLRNMSDFSLLLATICNLCNHRRTIMRSSDAARDV
jgi:hypothetical protein